MSAAACSFCHEGGHKASKCPELMSDLWPGFSHENGATGREDPDEDDALYSSLSSGLVKHLNMMYARRNEPIIMITTIPGSIV